MGLDSLENVFSLGGEDSYLRLYDKDYPSYVAMAKFSQHSYRCMSVVVNGYLPSLQTKKSLLCAVDNLGTMKYFTILL